MSTAAKRVPRIETAAKRSRQKTADEAIAATKPAPARNSKRAKSTERSESKPRKTSVSRAKQTSGPSRSASRSPSRQKRSSAKAALGPKVLTKKELENARSKRGASRSRRSPSVTRGKSKSAERKSADRSRTKDVDQAVVDDLQIRFGSDNVKRNTYFEDDDISPSTARYSLRKRASPGANSPAKSTSSSSINISRRDTGSKSCWLTCGYLKYKKCDVCKIVVATVVLLVALAIINYFHLVDLGKIKDSVGSVCKFVTANLVTKPLGFCCDTSRAVIDSLKAFVTNAWTRITS